MRLPNAAEPATAAAVNRLQDDLQAGIVLSVTASPVRRQRLTPSGIRHAVVSRAFAMRGRASGPLATTLDLLVEGGRLS
jgi:hypothetical protein